MIGTTDGRSDKGWGEGQETVSSEGEGERGEVEDGTQQEDKQGGASNVEGNGMQVGRSINGMRGKVVEGSVPFKVTLIDSPGWGDLMSLPRSFRLVTRHIDRRFERQLQAESRLSRTPRSTVQELSSSRVDVVLYTLTPHRCKGIDVAFLQRLAKRVSIVPVLTKADTMTRAEVC